VLQYSPAAAGLARSFTGGSHVSPLDCSSLPSLNLVYSIMDLMSADRIVWLPPFMSLSL